MASLPSKQRIVLALFGCFNPPTFQHFRMFELARDALHRMEGYEVVRGIISPVHDKYPKTSLIPSLHRVAMLRMSVVTNDWIQLHDWETKQQDWTLTNTVLKQLQSELNAEYKEDLPAPRVMLLCGADLLESFSQPGLWATKDLDEILKNHGVVVISRDGSDAKKIVYENDQLSECHNQIVFVREWVRHDLSSTKVRRCFKRGESAKYLTFDSVIDYIKEQKLYQ